MSSAKDSEPVATGEVKQCCARVYETDTAKLLLGDSFHPGGLKLTARLGELLRLTEASRVLDVASGKGTSAIFLAERFACEVVGIDYSEQNAEQANRDAAVKALGQRLTFQQGDAESLAFTDGAFDAIVCECAFCTFPDKSRAAHEFARVLRPGGRVGLSDLTRGPELPQELAGLLAWVSCIADAQQIEKYAHYLRSAGFSVEAVESHDEALSEMVQQIQGKLFAADVMSGLKKIELPEFNFSEASRMAKAALSAIEAGQLGYAIIMAEKPTRRIDG
jgi:arsenite methyltransferase